MEGKLISVDRGSKRIMNLEHISVFRETGALKLEVDGSDEQAK